MKKLSFSVARVVKAAVLVFGMALFLGLPAAQAQTSAAQDNNIRAEVTNHLKGSNFKNVQVSVKNGVVDLEGSVNNYAMKEEADKRAHRAKNVVAVRNEIKIEGAGEISDRQLQDNLVKKLQYDRVGYGNAFNAISVRVENGVVTLGGHALGPVAADSAVALASTTRGVRDVINDIQVDPLSPMDNRIRIAVYRAVYGFPSLNKYAIDPAQPIRITVQNGHVILNGTVLNEADKNAAGIRANSVSGVFSVTNDLQVANKPSEKK